MHAFGDAWQGWIAGVGRARGAEGPVLGVQVHGGDVDVQQAQNGTGVLPVADAVGRKQHCVREFDRVHI